MSELLMWGGTDNPIGTLEEVKSAGLNPEKVCSCTAPVKNSGIRACPLAGACRFDRPRYGGFKYTTGPQNIGWETITGDMLPTGEPVVQQSWGPCYYWVKNLQKRAEFGLRQRMDGKPGEIVTIVARQGGKVVSRLQMPINVNGEVINQTREMFQTLEDQGTPINRDDRRPAHDYIMVEVKATVPPFPRPGQRPALSYAQRMLKAASDRLDKEREIEDAIITGGANPIDPDDLVSENVSGALAVPVKRGPGRPRKYPEAQPVEMGDAS